MLLIGLVLGILFLLKPRISIKNDSWNPGIGPGSPGTTGMFGEG